MSPPTSARTRWLLPGKHPRHQTRQSRSLLRDPLMPMRHAACSLCRRVAQHPGAAAHQVAQQIRSDAIDILIDLQATPPARASWPSPSSPRPSRSPTWLPRHHRLTPSTTAHRNFAIQVRRHLSAPVRRRLSRRLWCGILPAHVPGILLPPSHPRLLPHRNPPPLPNSFLCYRPPTKPPHRPRPRHLRANKAKSSSSPSTPSKNSPAPTASSHLGPNPPPLPTPPPAQSAGLDEPAVRDSSSNASPLPDPPDRLCSPRRSLPPPLRPLSGCDIAWTPSPTRHHHHLRSPHGWPARGHPRRHRHTSRVGVSISAKRRPATVHRPTADQYIQIACDLPTTPNKAPPPPALRAQMQNSPPQRPQFTQNLESAYRQMWRHWCL